MRIQDDFKELDEEWSTGSSATESAQFGRKTQGLVRVPRVWRLRGLAISTALWREYKKEGERGLRAFMDAAWPHISKWLAKCDHAGSVLLRSSGTRETIRDRGRFLSERIELATASTLYTSAVKIFKHFESCGAPGEMALLLQPFHKPRIKGHASNFRRLSKTKNQWQAEVEDADLVTVGFAAGYMRRYNSQRNEPPRTDQHLPRISDEDDLLESLKGICAWLARNLADVVAIEWLDDGKQLWLVQCDDEIDPPDAIDPEAVIFDIPERDGASEAAPAPFVRFVVNARTPIRKLSLLRDFVTEHFHVVPEIYYASASDLSDSLANRSARETLSARIDAFGPNGVVLRTEITAEGQSELPNLPRTDTVTGEHAVQWLAEQSTCLAGQGFKAEEIHFLMHRFIRARGSAWSYHEPGARTVLIDGIWGLPDGLQYYPHDSFEFDLEEQKILRVQNRYKPYILWPRQSGKWVALPVKASKARGQALSLAELKVIANHTAAISRKIKAPAQVMWFCTFEAGAEYQQPLPWFRVIKSVKPKVLEAAPPAPVTHLRTFDDLKRLAGADNRTKRIVLEPAVELVRNLPFLDEVIKFCTAHSASVVFSGSTLGHAYYQLAAAGVPVYAAVGSGRRRTINKHEFGKLVRDRIPEKISKRGDVVRFGVVEEQFKRALLIAKVVEELSELTQAREHAYLEELADLYEVVRALALSLGVKWEDLIAAADTKRAKRGGFEEGFVLLETSLSEEDEDDENEIAPTGRLIIESTMNAINAALSVKEEPNSISVSVTDLLKGKPLNFVVLLPDNRSVRVKALLNGARLEVSWEIVVPPEPDRKI